MRVVSILAFALVGCASVPPPPPPPPPAVAAPEPPGPVVVRRLLGETRELIAQNQALARELPDPRGRARAQVEADVLAVELAKLEAGYPTEDSAELDALVAALAQVESQASLLHDSLRIATSRISALSPEP